MHFKLFGATIEVPEADGLNKKSTFAKVSKEAAHDRSSLENEKSTAPPTVATKAEDDNDDDAVVWHYRDPHGKTRGPFSMKQLRKWNSTCVFPKTLRVWSTGKLYETSMLLADLVAIPPKKALDGRSFFPAGTELQSSKQPDAESCSSADRTSEKDGVVKCSKKRAIISQANTQEKESDQKRLVSQSGHARSSRKHNDHNDDTKHRRIEDDHHRGLDYSSVDDDRRRHSHHQQHHRSSSPKYKHEVACRYYQRGYCRYGSYCEFGHWDSR